MNGPTTLLVLAGIAVFAYFLIRLVRSIVGPRLWQLTLIILAVTMLAAAGLVNINPVLNEIGYAVTNMFGTPTEGNHP
jgi:hypothetical protein